MAIASSGLLLAGCGTTSSSNTTSSTTKSTTSSSTSSSASKAVTITWAASPIANAGLRAALIKDFEKANPNIKVKLISQPTSTNTNKTSLTTEISGGSKSPDVYMGDVIWPAQFGKNHLALPLSSHFSSSFWKHFAPGLVKGATYKGQVYGAPFFMDAGFLYYRKDLLAQAHLPVPTTWQQLVSDSQTLQKKGLVKYGYVWQGKSYEGLTCDYMEVLSDAGGKVITSSNKVLINSPQAIKATTFLRSLITSKVSPKAVTTFTEPQAMSTFASGKSAFLRNWDYAWAYSNNKKLSKVVGKVGVVPMPTFSGQSKPGYSTIGGWNNYINPHSAHIKQDVAFIKFLSGTTAQTLMATKYSLVPTNYAVQKSPSVQKQNKVLAMVYKLRLIARPSYNPNYSKISRAIYTNVNAALSGSITPKAAMAAAAKQIKAAVSGSSL